MERTLAGRGPPSSLVQLRTAVWTGVTRDTMPLPDSCTAVKKHHHSITSSAAEMKSGESAIPSARAVRRFTMKSIFVD